MNVTPVWLFVHLINPYLMSTKKTVHIAAPAPKKAYKTPKLTVLGSVKKLTLKTGSNVDGFGGSFG